MFKYIFRNTSVGAWLRKHFHKLRGRQKILLPHLIHADADRHGIAMVMIVKNEAPYVSEWIAFHGLRGVRHIYIYDNMSDDDLDGAVQRSTYADRVTVIRWGSFCQRQQDAAYNHAVTTFGSQYRWMGFFDIDEFVIPLKQDNFNEVFRQFEDQPCVALPWHMFGTSGHQDPPAGPVLENYVMREPFPPDPRKNVVVRWKVFVDPSKVRLMLIHRAELDGLGMVSFAQNGMVFDQDTRHLAEILACEYLQLHHYYTRSRKDFADKLEKGGGANACTTNRNKRVLQRFDLIEENPVRDTTAHRYVKELNVRLRRGAPERLRPMDMKVAS